EAGIREFHVTGVQTCALPISYYMWNRHDSAGVHLEQAMELARKVGDEKLESRIYSALGNVHAITGKYKEALEYNLKAIPYVEGEGDQRSLGLLYSNIAGLYHKM